MPQPLWSLNASRAVEKTWRKLDPIIQQRFAVFVQEIVLLENPTHYREVKQLVGHPKRYRFRTSKFRIIFALNEAERIIEILAIGKRDEIYRKPA